MQIERLSEKRILCVGAGGLGTVALYLLAGCGIGTLGIADGDSVDLSNLDRQFLFDRDMIGKNKAESAVYRLKQLHPTVKYNVYPVFLTEDNAEAVLVDYDLVLAAVDSLFARLLLNRVCSKLSIPLISGGVDGKTGMLQFVRYGVTACLSCVYDGTPDAERKPISDPSVVSVISAWMAEVARDYLITGKDPLDGCLLMYDAKQLETSRVRLARRTDCTICAHISQK